MFLETSLSPLQTALQDGQGYGCPGSSRERTRPMLSDLRSCGSGSVGLRWPLLSILAVMQSVFHPGGRGREEGTHGLTCVTCCAGPHIPYLCWSFVSFALCSKAGVVPGLIPIRQVRSQAQGARHAGTPPGALGETNTTPAQVQPGGNCRCPRSLPPTNKRSSLSGLNHRWHRSIESTIETRLTWCLVSPTSCCL